MKNQKETYQLLDMMLRPAFCVSGGRIVKLNAAAQGLLLCEGDSILPLLATGREEYEAFEGGCLYLQLALPGGVRGAAVSRLGDAHLFLPEAEAETGELQALALAARELREPLNNLIAISGNLLPHAVCMEDPKVSCLMASMSRGLYQMQRVLGNMSDAGQGIALSCQEIRNIPQVFSDIFEKASVLLSYAGIPLRYTGINRDLMGLIDDQQMERAVLNILSNAAKFTDSGSSLDASLTLKGNSLRLSIQDSGPGIEGEILGSLFSRYLRQPALEDRRHGLGLGMVMVRSAAVSHGGTVLIDQPEGSGVRVTLTMKIRQTQESQVRSSRLALSGGRDQALIELSGLLPVSVYEKEL